MARIAGADPSQQGLFHGLFTRVIYALTKRKVGRVVMPVKIAAHHGKILWGYGQMEQSLLSSHLVDEALKNLGQLRVATLVVARFELTLVLRSAEPAGFPQRRSWLCPTTVTVSCFLRRKRWCWNTPTA